MILALESRTTGDRVSLTELDRRGLISLSVPAGILCLFRAKLCLRAHTLYIATYTPLMVYTAVAVRDNPTLIMANVVEDSTQK